MGWVHPLVGLGWVGSGEDFYGLGCVQKFWVGLGFEKVTHDQLWCVYAHYFEKLTRVPVVCLG